MNQPKHPLVITYKRRQKQGQKGNEQQIQRALGLFLVLLSVSDISVISYYYSLKDSLSNLLYDRG